MTDADDAWRREFDAMREELEGCRRRLELSRAALIATDPEGYITEWSVAATRLFDYEESEILGQHLLKLFDNEVEYGLVLDCGMDPENAGVTIRHRRRDGNAIWVRLRLLLEQDEAGSPVGMLLHIVDVQQNVVDMEQASLRSRVFEIVPIPVAITDPAGRVVSANRAWTKWCHSPAEEVLGRTCPLLDWNAETCVQRSIFEAVISATGTWQGKTAWAWQHGAPVTVEATITALVGPLGARNGYMVLLTDIGQTPDSGRGYPAGRAVDNGKVEYSR